MAHLSSYEACKSHVYPSNTPSEKNGIYWLKWNDKGQDVAELQCHLHVVVLLSIIIVVVVFDWLSEVLYT